MAYTPKPNSGSLFKNDKKSTDQHPDWNGTLLVGSVEYRLSAWVKEGKKGKFFSLSLTPAKKPTSSAATSTDIDDSWM
jgi:hypothetical protein